MGINFIDTKIIRQVYERGTSSYESHIKSVDFMGDENKQRNLDRLNLAGGMWIMNAKGTSRIDLSKMRKATPVDAKGHYISIGKGTGRIKI